MKTLSEIIEERVNKKFTENNNKENVDKNTFPSKEILTDKLNEIILKDIPNRYKNAEITDEEINEIVKRCLEKQKGVYFYGGAGTGKTWILYGILKRMRAFGNRYCEVINLPEWLSDVRSNFSQDSADYYISQRVKDNSTFLIDDFGAEKVTDWNTEIMYRFINYRYENMLPTFFASNLSLQEIAERSGDRVASRIAEMCEVKKIDGEDKRLKIEKLAKENK